MKYIILLLMLVSGCTSARYTVTTGNEKREFSIIRPGYDTKIGELDVQTPDGVKLHLKDVDSKEKGTQLIEKLIDKIPNATVVP